MEASSAVSAVADVGLLLVYGGVILFFVLRYVRFRKAPSIGVALLPLGWIFLALINLQILSGTDGLVSWCGVVIGCFLLVSVLRAEREEGTP